MATFYTAVDTSNWISQPNFMRSRSRYRGVRESAKFNLEMAQFLYDVRRLTEIQAQSLDALTANLSTLENGGRVADVYYQDHQTRVVLPGTLSLAAQLEILDERIKNLEGI